MKSHTGNMSLSKVINSIEHEAFESAMNPPEPHNGQAYIQKDYKTGKYYVCCPYCSKKNLQIKRNTSISNLELKCKGSGCKKTFLVNIKDGKEIG